MRFLLEGRLEFVEQLLSAGCRSHSIVARVLRNTSFDLVSPDKYANAFGRTIRTYILPFRASCNILDRLQQLDKTIVSFFGFLSLGYVYR